MNAKELTQEEKDQLIELGFQGVPWDRALGTINARRLARVLSEKENLPVGKFIVEIKEDGSIATDPYAPLQEQQEQIRNRQRSSKTDSSEEWARLARKLRARGVRLSKSAELWSSAFRREVARKIVGEPPERALYFPLEEAIAWAKAQLDEDTDDAENVDDADDGNVENVENTEE